jgi:hypothetical protein
VLRVRSPVPVSGTRDERIAQIATLQQYDQVIEKMGVRRGGEMPSGGLSHWVCATEC